LIVYYYTLRQERSLQKVSSKLKTLSLQTSGGGDVFGLPFCIVILLHCQKHLFIKIKNKGPRIFPKQQFQHITQFKQKTKISEIVIKF